MDNDGGGGKEMVRSWKELFPMHRP